MNGPTFATQPVTKPVAAVRPPAPPFRTPPKPADGLGYPVVAWLKLHWLAVLFCGSLLGSTMAYLVWSLMPVEYESYGLLQVASAPFTVSNQKDPNRSRSEFATYLKTNRELIKYEFVLLSALNKPQSGEVSDVTGPRIGSLPTLASQPDPLRYLDEKLTVSSPEGSELIKVSLKGSNPADVQMIVNAVQSAFMDKVVEEEIADRAKFLTKVESTREKLRELLGKTTGGGPQVPPAVPGDKLAAPPAVVPLGPPDQVKRAMTQRLIQQVAILTDRVEVFPRVIASQKAKVDFLDAEIKKTTAVAPSPEAYSAADNDPQVKALAERVQYLRAKYVTDRATYANPNVPSVTDSLAQAEQADSQLQTLRQKRAVELEASRWKGKTNDLTARHADAVREYQSLQEQLQLDAKLLSEKQKELAALPGDPLKESEKHDAEKKAPTVNPASTILFADDEVLRGLSTYATQLRLDQDSPKRVTERQKASTPAMKDGKKQLLMTIAAGLMGFVLAGFAAVGYELSVRKLSTLSELSANVSMPVVGVIPWQPGETWTPGAAEGIDKLRSYVAQTWLARGATTVAVTSPLGDEGKAVTAFGLANSLAAAGYKTLLVDFDLRTPAVHSLGGVPNGPGVCELIRGEADFRKTIQTLPTGLHLMTAGQWSDEARQAAVGGRLDSLLSRLREPFDCVILHTHSLLTAADTLEVARRSEVVLVAALCRDSRVPLVKKAAERVAAMEIPYSGVVYLGATPHEALC